MESAAAQSWWWYALWMLLFLAVNAHAAAACVHALQQERRAAKLHAQRCARKRSLMEGVYAPPSTYSSSAAGVAVTRRRKRRKLGGGGGRLGLGLSRRESLFTRDAVAAPWPLHVSFYSLDILGDSERLVATWLAHPLVAAGVAKLRELACSALQELLVSLLSFVLCATAVVLLRRYSTLVVGVSVDLGAFSVDI